jgi:uncharacterized protein YndB with AHSA1/START domain
METLLTLKFEEVIEASPDKVWKVLWDDETYRQWTAVFAVGSYAESDWIEGSDIRFLNPEGSGMLSVIEKRVENQLMVFKHLKDIVNGELKDTTWSGATESYELISEEGETRLIVELQSTEGPLAYFKETFPKALVIVKELSQRP